MGTAHYKAFVARKKQSSNAIGFVTYEPNNGHVQLLAVDKKYRGQGVGYSLLRKVLKTFKDNGRGHADLISWNASAIALYQRMGFEVVGGYTCDGYSVSKLACDLNRLNFA